MLVDPFLRRVRVPMRTLSYVGIKMERESRQRQEYRQLLFTEGEIAGLGG